MKATETVSRRSCSTRRSRPASSCSSVGIRCVSFCPNHDCTCSPAYCGFQLEREKLGDVDGRSISAAFFGQAAMVQPIGALNEDEKDLLGGWVTALFGSEGIADDLLQ